MTVLIILSLEHFAISAYLCNFEVHYGHHSDVVRRLAALKKILAALSASIVPMMNAFLIMLIVAMICETLDRSKNLFSKSNPHLNSNPLRSVCPSILPS
jgi:hypothetical protein